MTLQTKLLVIIYAYKISAKKENFFFKQNLEILLESLASKPKRTEGHLIMYLHQFHSYLNKGSNYLFFLKIKSLRNCKKFKTFFLSLHRINFYLQKCKKSFEPWITQFWANTFSQTLPWQFSTKKHTKDAS
jgi:hypothetical protein